MPLTSQDKILRGAIRSNVSNLTSIVKQGADVNSVDHKGLSTVEFAYLNRKMVAVIELIELLGADIKPSFLSTLYSDLANKHYPLRRRDAATCLKALVRKGLKFDMTKQKDIEDPELLVMVNNQNASYFSYLLKPFSMIKSLFGSRAIPSEAEPPTIIIEEAEPDVKPEPKPKLKAKAKPKAKRKATSKANPNKRKAPAQSDAQPIKKIRLLKLDPEEAATIIQRFWRRHLVKNLANSTELKTQKYISSIQSQYCFAPLPGLDVDPPLPKKERAIDPAKLEAYLKDFASEPHRKVARKVIERDVSYISTAQLFDEMKKVTAKFNSLFKSTFLNQPINMLIERGHSSEWISGLAARYLSTRPVSLVELQRFYDLDLTTNVRFNSAGRATLLYIDDVSYSGMQIVATLDKIERTMSQHANKKLDIFIIIPFMSKKAFQLINELPPKYNNFNLMVFKPSIIPSMSGFVLSPQEKRLLFEICGNYNKYTKYKSGDADKYFNRKSLIFTEWKTPDYVSAPMHIMKGIIDDALRVQGCPYKEHHFIPDVKPPYSKSN